MKISARNVLKGEIIHVNRGAVNSTVAIELSDGFQITAVITNKSVETLGLENGKDACAVIKASNVMLAVD